MTEQELINKAQREITEILKALEKDIGRDVTGIELSTVDLTCVMDTRKKLLKSVLITADESPVTTW